MFAPYLPNLELSIFVAFIISVGFGKYTSVANCVVVVGLANKSASIPYCFLRKSFIGKPLPAESCTYLPIISLASSISSK